MRLCMTAHLVDRTGHGGFARVPAACSRAVLDPALTAAVQSPGTAPTAAPPGGLQLGSDADTDAADVGGSHAPGADAGLEIHER